MLAFAIYDLIGSDVARHHFFFDLVVAMGEFPKQQGSVFDLFLEGLPNRWVTASN